MGCDAPESVLFRTQSIAEHGPQRLFAGGGLEVLFAAKGVGLG
jgi:hypothetical protein